MTMTEQSITIFTLVQFNKFDFWLMHGSLVSHKSTAADSWMQLSSLILEYSLHIHKTKLLFFIFLRIELSLGKLIPKTIVNHYYYMYNTKKIVLRCREELLILLEVHHFFWRLCIYFFLGANVVSWIRCALAISILSEN